MLVQNLFHQFRSQRRKEKLQAAGTNRRQQRRPRLVDRRLGLGQLGAIDLDRPIVLPDNLDIEIGIATPNQEIFLTLDGQEGLPITERDHVRIRKSAQSVLLVQSPDKNYFDVLRAKLKWGES